MYALDFLRIVGMPNIFIEKVVPLEIKNYRALLPCDFHEMIQVRLTDKNIRNNIFIYASNNFHYSENKEDAVTLTYKILGNVIYTSLKECNIEIAYRAIAIDEDGYPLIPDSSAVTRALELYIKKQCFTILFDLNKINQNVYQNTQQEYAWAVGQAQSDLVRPSLDEMQSITNSLNTILVRNNEHNKGFKTNNVQEKIKIH